MEDDDFQFVDFGANDPNNDLKLVREEIQKLRETLSAEDSQVKALEKEMKEWRATMNAMGEELKKVRQEKETMQKGMEAMEQKNKGVLKEINSLKQEVEQLKKNQIAQKTSLGSYVNAINNIEEKSIQQEGSNGNAKGVLKELDKSQCYSCKSCGTHIGLESDIINRSYQVGQGPFTEAKRGFLFKNAVNLTLGIIKTETFTSGSYEISWTNCSKCGASLGWKYLTSSNETNLSKVGKFCLARYSLTSPQERNDI
ncbi:fad NAD binding oxidoreductase [Reticulomyxa filosa]|uniref:Fad NAD binding oxidoreductase n=1 Tax=Reticulomyxa filosa TaxID=46433 RepID=X6M3H2_RETFI|nr:fad NAD binding oxidoreductase [Reticulomyxa filosa]|eukprot:ETO08474.1 fad NAD binding oxidoreductase [Reticulomyxa filosa]